MKLNEEYIARMNEIVDELEEYIETDVNEAVISDRTAFDILYIIRDHKNTMAQLAYEQNERKGHNE